MHNFPRGSEILYAIFMSLFKSLAGFLGLNKITVLGAARTLLTNCKRHSENFVWYSGNLIRTYGLRFNYILHLNYLDGLITNNFRSSQTLIMLHIWLIHKRLLQRTEKSTKLQEVA
jgi:hypothetical protein